MPTIDELKRESSVAVVVADQKGFITYVNPRFEKLLGWRAKEIVGKPLTTLIPKNLHDAHHLGFSRFLSTGRPTLLNRPLKLKTVTKGGREIETEHCIIAEEHQGQWVFGATLRPLQEKS